MENITCRFCDYQNDPKRLMDFWLDYRAASDVRMYPTIWRIRLLLTSRVWEPEKDTQIWENTSGQLIGFAMLWRRHQTSPYVVLDSFIHPKFVTQGIVRAVLEWGNNRANDMAKGQEGEFSVYVSGLSQHDFSANFLGQYGYTIVPPNPEGHNVYFAKPLLNALSAPSLPAGYEIRKLQNVAELEACQAISGFAKVNSRHLKELLDSEEYCHFAVLNPDDEFVAYCECSVCRAEWKRTNQRIGWIDYVETRPERQKKGLGRAALSAGLLKLRELGAETAMLVTINTNIPAVALYNRTGFDSVEVMEYPSYQKQIVIPKTE